jgi:hypothetical protein
LLFFVKIKSSTNIHATEKFSKAIYALLSFDSMQNILNKKFYMKIRYFLFKKATNF